MHIEAAPGQRLYRHLGYPRRLRRPPFAGEYTFYGRYVAWTAADNREPLATNFAARYINGGAFNGGTDLICWRDSKVNQGPFTCPACPGVRPTWFPLSQEAHRDLRRAGEPGRDPSPSPFSPPPETEGPLPCPARRSAPPVGGPDLPVPFNFGWLYLNLNTTVAAAGPNPPEDPAAAQAWVTTVMNAQGRFCVGFDAIQLDSATNANHFTPGK